MKVIEQSYFSKYEFYIIEPDDSLSSTVLMFETDTIVGSKNCTYAKQFVVQDDALEDYNRILKEKMNEGYKEIEEEQK